MHREGKKEEEEGKDFQGRSKSLTSAPLRGMCAQRMDGRTYGRTKQLSKASEAIRDSICVQLIKQIFFATKKLYFYSNITSYRQNWRSSHSLNDISIVFSELNELNKRNNYRINTFLLILLIKLYTQYSFKLSFINPAFTLQK